MIGYVVDADGELVGGRLSWWQWCGWRGGQLWCGLLTEISEGRFSLFSMEGFVVLLPKGQKGGGEDEGPRILLEWQEKEEVWRGRIRSRLEWRGVKVGQFSFGIEVQPVR